MTQEEKQLLLKDLCARFPYGVKVRINTKNNYYTAIVCEITRNYICIEGGGEICFSHGSYKPYLRPMSSMTEEEIKEFSYRVFQQPDLNMVKEWKTLIIDSNQLSKPVDFLNEKMFDWHKIKRDNKYISMIEAGLALEAPEGMYKFNN